MRIYFERFCEEINFRFSFDDRRIIDLKLYFRVSSMMRIYFERFFKEINFRMKNGKDFDSFSFDDRTIAEFRRSCEFISKDFEKKLIFAEMEKILIRFLLTIAES